MAGRGYSIFDTGVGRCGIAWSDAGIVGVQLPEAREIETRKRLFQLYPDAREQRPPANVEIAIEGIVALLRGEPADLSDVALDISGVPDFNVRVYAFTRGIPRGETLTYGEIAAKLRLSGAVHSVAQALARNPFVIIVPCHRVLEAGGYADRMSPNGGVISKRRLLSVEGAHGAPPARPCSTCCCPLPRRARRAKFGGMNRTTLLQRPSISVSDFRCTAGSGEAPFVERNASHSISYVRKGSFGCHAAAAVRAGGGIDAGRPSRRRIPVHPRSRRRRRMPVVLARAGTGGRDRRPARCLADRLCAAAAGTDGARRTGAGRGGGRQRHRPRRERAALRQPLRRRGRRAAAAPAPANPRSPPRGRNRAVDRRAFAPADRSRQRGRQAD